MEANQTPPSGSTETPAGTEPPVIATGGFVVPADISEQRDAAPASGDTPVVGDPAAPTATAEPEKPADPATPPGDAPKNPWQVMAEKAEAEAKAAGFDSPEAYIAAKQQERQKAAQEAQQAQAAEATWRNQTHNRIAADLKNQLDAGDITQEDAAAEYDRLFDEAEAERTSTQVVQKQTDEQIMRHIQLVQRELSLDISEAAKSNPYLLAGNGEASQLIEALVIADLDTTPNVIKLFADHDNAVAERAVANYIAEQAKKPAVSVLSPGAQAPMTGARSDSSYAPTNAPGGWLSHLGLNLER